MTAPFDPEAAAREAIAECQHSKGFCLYHSTALATRAYAAGVEAAIKEYEGYLAFLDQANNSPIMMAFVHGWRCPDADVEQGKAWRDRLTALRAPEPPRE